MAPALSVFFAASVAAPSFRVVALSDWECRKVERRVGRSPLFPWNRFRQDLQTSVGQKRELPSTQLTEAALTDIVFDNGVHGAALQECLIGTIVLTLIFFMDHCIGVELTERCDLVGEIAMHDMFRRDVPFSVLAVSGWCLPWVVQTVESAIGEQLQNPSSFWFQLRSDRSLQCDDKEWWPGFLQTTAAFRQAPSEASVKKMLHQVFQEHIWSIERTKAIGGSYWLEPDCKLGWVSALMLKAMVCFNSETECYFTYSDGLLDHLMRVPFHEFVGSAWPLPHLFGILAAQFNCPLELDFFDEELMNEPPFRGGEFSGETGPEVWSVMRQLKGRASPPFLHLAQAVLADGAKAYDFQGERRLFAYAAFVWGDQYHPWIRPFLQRFQRVGVHNMILFCSDSTSFEMCAQVDRSRCIHLPTQTILQRYTIPLVALQLGVDIFVLDFDIYPFQDPTPHVVGELLSYGSRVPDVLVAGSFGDACILNAMVFYRSTRRARDFLRGLLRWLYENPFPHGVTQKALSAFLGEDPLQKSQGAGGGPPGPPRYGEPGAPWVVRAEALQRGLGQDPREGALPTVDWALLSPENAFVSARVGATSGWAGAVGGIVLFHFFHGGWVESGSVFEQARAHDDDFEVFFGGAADGGEEGASRRSRIVERVLSSRVGDARPPTALSCSTVPVDVFSSGRPGAA